MQSTTNPFSLYIITHGRPDAVFTIERGFRKSKYSGDWFLVIDDEDETLPEYVKRYGEDRCIIYPKQDTIRSIDLGDNFGLSGSVVARAAVWEIAKKRYDRYFIVLDDDYDYWDWQFDEESKAIPYTDVLNLDQTLQALVDWFADLPERVICVSCLQHGDFIGGQNGSNLSKIFAKRKAMNVFVCSTERPFTFPGRMNEDVNAYTEVQRRGYAFMSMNRFAFHQMLTQQTKGGMTEIYQSQGTYVKSFYSVMRCPSGVKISVLGDRNVNPRIHHRVSYNAVAPKILPQRYKKAESKPKRRSSSTTSL